jgi:hypothetical protein
MKGAQGEDAQFLIERRLRKAGKKLSRDWEGSLKDYRNRYPSLELQKKALEWQGN